MWGRHQRKGFPTSCHGSDTESPIPCHSRRRDSPCVTIPEVFEGVDPNDGYSRSHQRWKLMTCTGSTTTPDDPKRTKQKGFFLKKNQNSTRTEPLLHHLRYLKESKRSPIWLKDTSDPKDNEKTTLDREKIVVYQQTINPTETQSYLWLTKIRR